MDNWSLLLMLILCLPVSATIVLTVFWLMEQVSWNRGVCRKSGKPWKLLSDDKQGRFYCSECEIIRITHDSVDKPDTDKTANQ